jgi:hypothetical protein
MLSVKTVTSLSTVIKLDKQKTRSVSDFFNLCLIFIFSYVICLTNGQQKIYVQKSIFKNEK